MSYQRTLKFPVKYINLPKDKFVSNNLPDSLELELKASGFDIIHLRLQQHLEPIEIDASSYKPHKGSDYYYITTNTKLDHITRQMHNGMKIMSVFPDTIFLNFSKKISKTVPVRIRVDLNFKQGFQQNDSIVIFPKEIRISGSPLLVEKVKELRAEDLSLKELDRPITIRRALVISSDLKQLEFSSDSVSLKIPVAKFTEGMVEISVETLHVPSGTSLKVFPDKVKITYLVSFDSFEKIKADMFRAVVDYAKLEEGSNKIRVDLQRSPTIIRSVVINPDRVEYIIRK
jgi:YbbR domain-containing protein